jgi:hypothetical protein
MLPTPALASPQDDSGTAAAAPVAEASEPIDRRVIRDIALVVLAHLAFLLLLSLSWLRATEPSPVAGAWLEMYFPEAPNALRDRGATPTRSREAPRRRVDVSPAVVADNRATDVDSLAEVAGSADAQAADAVERALSDPAAHTPIQAPSPDDSPALETATEGGREALPGAEQASSESPAPGSSPLLATLSESGLEQPPRSDPAPAGPAPLEISTAQAKMLTRKVTAFAQTLRDSDLAPAPRSWRQRGRGYTAEVTRQPARNDTDIDRVVVEITAEEGGKRWRTQLQLKRLAFSHFTQLVDYWDTDVQLHDDEITGRFHSNTEILLGYDRTVAPRFLGKVTTAASEFKIGNASGSKRLEELFRGGIETQAGRIVLPEPSLAFLSSRGPNNGSVRTFSHDTRLTFYADGSYSWQTPESDAPAQRELISAAPYYIAVARKSSVFVRGTVSGNVLVYSPERIVVEGDLVYAHDPRATPDAGDYLGLISDRDIEIARPAVTGPGDLRIDAAVYAKRRFVVTDENARGSATLRIYGSLTAGSISATEPRYATKIEYDRRFEHARPAGFPMTNRYELESWDAHWAPVAEHPEP